MELKHGSGSKYGYAIDVLIVPSGIETESQFISQNKAHIVLIVPSGIETPHRVPRGGDYLVLIVPSGIETREGHWPTVIQFAY